MIFFNKTTVSLAFLLIANIAAAAPRYAIIIDAGSTGSRLHLFEYQMDKDHPISIKDIFTEKVQPGLSSYADHPTSAGASLKKLFDDADTKLKALQVDAHDVSVNVLGTAGMRKLPESTQKDIYSDIQNYLTQHYAFKIAGVKTITGKMEGVYAWLDVNYQEGNFASNKNTLGIIDMGGASTQIAFATQYISKPDDEVSIQLNKQHYTIFSKSFLGLGMNEARSSASQFPNATSCYPSGYFSNSSSSNQYNFKECNTVYSKIIEHYQINQQLIPFDQTLFAVFSGAYYVYNFFGVEDASQGALEARMHNICNMSWKDMQNEYKDSNISDDTLSSYCANGIYLDNLFYNTYHLSSSQMWVTSKTHNQQEIDWTLGALLYVLAQAT